jgi:hypothetical protein
MYVAPSSSATLTLSEDRKDGDKIVATAEDAINDEVQGVRIQAAALSRTDDFPASIPTSITEPQSAPPPSRQMVPCEGPTTQFFPP